jgi:hypothetical protein
MNNKLLDKKSRQVIIEYFNNNFYECEYWVDKAYDILLQLEDELHEAKYFDILLERLEQYDDLIETIHEDYEIFLKNIKKTSCRSSIFQESIVISERLKFIINDLNMILSTVITGEFHNLDYSISEIIN